MWNDGGRNVWGVRAIGSGAAMWFAGVNILNFDMRDGVSAGDNWDFRRATIDHDRILTVRDLPTSTSLSTLQNMMVSLDIENSTNEEMISKIHALYNEQEILTEIVKGLDEEATQADVLEKYIDSIKNRVDEEVLEAMIELLPVEDSETE